MPQLHPSPPLAHVVARAAEIQVLAANPQYNKAQLVGLSAVCQNICATLQDITTIGTITIFTNKFAEGLDRLFAAIKDFNSANSAEKFARIDEYGNCINALGYQIFDWCQDAEIHGTPVISKTMANWELSYLQDKQHVDDIIKALSSVGSGEAIDMLLEIDQASESELMENLRQNLLPSDSLRRSYLVKALFILEARSKSSNPLDVFAIEEANFNKTRLATRAPLIKFFHGVMYGKYPVTAMEFDERVSMMEFCREMKVWSNLFHRNITELLGCCMDADCAIAITPFAEYGNLLTHLADLPNGIKLRVVSDVAAGLEYLHSRGVIHGELCSANVVIDNFGVAKLVNFGMSMLYAMTKTLTTTEDRTHVRWQSPEMVEHGRLEKTADVFSLGVTAWEILMLQKPWREYDDLAAANHVMAGNTLEIPAIHFAPGPMWILIKATWNHRPENRPTAADVASEFARVLHTFDKDRPITQDISVLEKEVGMVAFK